MSIPPDVGDADWSVWLARFPDTLDYYDQPVTFRRAVDAALQHAPPARDALIRTERKAVVDYLEAAHGVLMQATKSRSVKLKALSAGTGLFAAAKIIGILAVSWPAAAAGAAIAAGTWILDSQSSAAATAEAVVAEQLRDAVRHVR